VNTPDFIIVAIDGGAAAGKSTTADALSERFHLLHVDTGSFYRAVTAELLRRGGIRLGTRVTGRRAGIELDGRGVGDEIRSKTVNENVSFFAAIPEVRQALFAYQRGQADEARRHGFDGLVMEGRDIGSVIFPDADFRFFLQADPLERARRRVAEGQQDAILERDRIDSSRKTAPLTCPPGAVAVDSTHLTREEVVARLATLIESRLNRP
jgi:cytidylate kinase